MKYIFIMRLTVLTGWAIFVLILLSVSKRGDACLNESVPKTNLPRFVK